MQLQIIAQYFENYADDKSKVDGAYWKPKGGHVFLVNCDQQLEDALMYGCSKADVEEMLTELLAKESNSHCRYEFVSYDAVFSQPTDLTKEFKALVSEKSFS